MDFPGHRTEKPAIGQIFGHGENFATKISWTLQIHEFYEFTFGTVDAMAERRSFVLSFFYGVLTILNVAT